MALLVLIVLGATIGWLASIVTRVEASRDILRLMGICVGATLVIGLIVNNGTFIGGLSLVALGAALVAGIGAVALYHTLIRRSAEA